MNQSVLSHLLTLASFRNLDLAQAIRLARMQLPAGSPAIASLVCEHELNAQAMADLELQIRKAA